MTFGKAIKELKAGRAVSRKGWSGKGMFIYMTQGTIINRSQLRGAADALIPTDSDSISIGGHIDMYTAQGTIIVGWLASQSDMLAEDWRVVGVEKA